LPWPKAPLRSVSGAADASADSAVKPRGKRDIRGISYSPWRKLCFEVSPVETVCRTTITGAMDTGQEMLRLDLIEGGGPESRIQMLLPVGMFLRSNAMLRVDQGEPLHIPFNWCMANACVAAVPVDAAFIRGLRSGRSLTLEAVDPNLLVVTATIPLDRFATVNEGPPTELFDESLSLRH
jgi:invasion protein IalB